MTDTTTCRATKRNGLPCSKPAIGLDGMCLFHSEDPRVVELRQAGRALGGKATGRVRHLQALKPVRKPREILDRLEELHTYLLAGEISPKVALAATKVLAEARETYEVLLLEQRLRDVLRKLGEPELPELHCERLEADPHVSDRDPDCESISDRVAADARNDAQDASPAGPVDR